MVRIVKRECEVADPATSKTSAVCDVRGTSDDTKPTEGMLTGSTFIEADTGKIFLYDEESEEWKEWT